MNASPNRVRLLRDGSHCACCSQWEIRVYAGEAVRDYRKPGRRIGNPHHGQVKLRGQHAYRRGLVMRVQAK